jgi:hypothetical protein
MELAGHDQALDLVGDLADLGDLGVRGSFHRSAARWPCDVSTVSGGESDSGYRMRLVAYPRRVERQGVRSCGI